MSIADDVKIIEQERDEHLENATKLADTLHLVTTERDELRSKCDSATNTIGLMTAENDRLTSQVAMLEGKVQWLERYTTEMRTLADIVGNTAFDLLKRARHAAYAPGTPKPEPSVASETIERLPMFLQKAMDEREAPPSAPADAPPTPTSAALPPAQVFQ